MTPRRHPRYPFAAQWLAYALPCRRFADALAGACARLGADVGCYSFIAVDLHHLLLAGLPAHAFPSLTHKRHAFVDEIHSGWVRQPHHKVSDESPLRAVRRLQSL